jgi:pantoate--beta-alanine ligase
VADGAAVGASSLGVVRSRGELARALAEIRGRGETLGLVPTMGYLHPGHLSLLDRARSLADRTALSIFVNPLQFAPGEDLDRYPRDEARDLALAGERGAHLAFAPSVEEMYPHGTPFVRVDPGPLGDRLCGLHRPGHFEGVLTVVARLFGLFRPDVAVFGRKDFQQAVLVRRMVQDLELGVQVEVAPLMREADGLAMSSRNAYLSPEERRAAPALFQGLQAAEAAFRAGDRAGESLADRVRTRLREEPHFRLEYVEVVDPETLESRAGAGEAVRDGDVLAVAAWLGATRLIDNRVLGAGEEDPLHRGPPESREGGA